MFYGSYTTSHFVLLSFFRSKNADMIISDLTVTESREEVVDFSIPFMFYTEEMLVKKQHSEGSIGLLQFMHPFHRDVWTATLFSLIVISIALFLINYFSPCEYLGTDDKLSLCDSVWFTVACMLRQASQNKPRNLSGTHVEPLKQRAS